MTRLPAVVVPLTLVLIFGTTATGQDAPPRIGPFAVDVRGTFPRFTREPQLAQSRGLSESELPGLGLGFDAGMHVYLLKWKAITFGLGGQITLARAHSSGQMTGRAVTERFTSISPQLSFNFGSGDGWSYISGGIGPSMWSVVPDGQSRSPADEARLKTINYGGGARWFAKRHVAFTFDVRFYAIDPGIPQSGFPGSPRTTMLIMGAGVSLK